MNKSKRIKNRFKPYLEVKRSYKGGRALPEGVEMHKLSSNENPLGSSPKVAQAIINATQNLNIYPDNRDTRLREKLVEYHDNRLDVDQFICANSGSEMIEMMLRAFTIPGDEVILSNPCFLPYHMFTKWQGAKVVDIPLLEPNYNLDINGILEAINDKTRIIFLASPNNPTGSYIPKSKIEELLSHLSKDILIIYDEVYHHFADAKDYTTALPYVQQGQSIIAVNSFSKAFGLASLRIGYAYSTLEIANYVRQLQRPFLLSKLAMEAGLAALSDIDFVDQTVDIIHEERDYISKEFDKISVKYTPTQGNFFIIDPRLPAPELVELLFQKGFMVRNVTNFGAPGKVRITIDVHEVNVGFIKAMKDIINDKK